MSDNKFYEEIKFMFESYLSPKKDRLKLQIKNITQNKILNSDDMNYSKVFFDSDLNIYKIDKSGKLQLIENDEFETVVMKQE